MGRSLGRGSNHAGDGRLWCTDGQPGGSPCFTTNGRFPAAGAVSERI